jgi:hypothetical protein
MTASLPHDGAVEGRFARVNDHGLQLVGEDSWLNISRYAKPAPKLPRVGDLAYCVLDKEGYVRSIDVLHDEPRARYDVEDGVDVPAPEEPSRQVERPLPIGNAVPDKDTQIRRMNALSTATAILSSGGRAVDLGEVTALAEILERWVTR